MGGGRRFHLRAPPPMARAAGDGVGSVGFTKRDGREMKAPAMLRSSPRTPSAMSAARRRRGVFHWRQRAARSRSRTGRRRICKVGPGVLRGIERRMPHWIWSGVGRLSR
jgi:hypothetical protein